MASRPKRKRDDVAPEAPCYLLSLPKDILVLILCRYLNFYFNPVLRLVCSRFRDLLSQGGRYFVENIGQRGFLRLAKWAWDNGAPFTGSHREVLICAAKRGELETIKWIVQMYSTWRIRIIPSEVFRLLVISDQDHEPFLTWLRLHAHRGFVKYTRAQYARAIKNDDAALMRRLLRANIVVGSWFWEMATDYNRIHLLDLVRIRDDARRGIAQPPPPGVNIVRWCTRYGHSRAYTAAVKDKKWPVLHWLADHGYQANGWHIRRAVHDRDLDMVRWLRNHIDPDEDCWGVCEIAVENQDEAMWILLGSLGYKSDYEGPLVAIIARNETAFVWCMDHTSRQREEIISIIYDPDNALYWFGASRYGADFSPDQVGSHRLWARDIFKHHFFHLMDRIDQYYCKPEYQ